MAGLSALPNHVFAHGFGAVAFGVKDTGFSFFLLIYYNQALGMDAGLVSAALLIALGNRQGSWHLGLITAISAYFAYTNVLGVGRALMRKDVIPHVLGLWPVHLLLLTVIALLYLWQRRRIRFGPKKRKQELLPA